MKAPQGGGMDVPLATLPSFQAEPATDEEEDVSLLLLRHRANLGCRRCPCAGHVTSTC